MQQDDERKAGNQANTKAFWDEKDYGIWEETAVDDRADPMQWSKKLFLRRLIPRIRGKTVLDLGCGPGVLTPYLATACESVVGLDFSSSAIAAARKRCSHLDNVSFVAGDVLDFDPGREFDVITGSMFLHEIMHDDTPRFLERLDSLMADRGFLYFHENSYFNIFGRFIRERLVGRYGVPKHGSENELPFDEARFRMYCEFFRYCERFVMGVELAQKVYEYMVPIKIRLVSGAALGMDKLLTAIQRRTGRLDNWSYTQTIYASQTVPRSEAIGAVTPK